MEKEKNENKRNKKKIQKDKEEKKKKTKKKKKKKNKKSKISIEEKKQNEVETKKLPEELKKRLRNNFFIAVGIIVYFGILILAHAKMKLDRLSCDIEIFASAFLLTGIYMLERAYKRDNGKVAINAIELLVLAFHSLSITYMSELLKYDFNKYLIISTGAFFIYYILKAIIIYTKNRKEYLDSLSDISEIVSEEKPIVKEATKKTQQKSSKKKKSQNKRGKEK